MWTNRGHCCERPLTTLVARYFRRLPNVFSPQLPTLGNPPGLAEDDLAAESGGRDGGAADHALRLTVHRGPDDGVLVRAEPQER